ncbi:MAG: hypothetical protein NT105_12945 [Verrucomicrobia bacterium]|nr:hypothetical protein [Verrucomicrobiota bacterium]
MSQVEQRLEDAAQLWRKASEQYFDPNEFRVTIQACIQAFRTVTWILQNNKDAILEFNSWYGAWQQKMRIDEILRWLVEARNRIEKQGDLFTKSTLKVTLSGSWFDRPHYEALLPPSTSVNKICSLIRSQLPMELANASEGLLCAERRWCDSELPHVEILEALCHCYSVLQELVGDAHRRLKVNQDTPCELSARVTQSNLELPKFMLNADTTRTTWLKLRDGTRASMAVVTQTVTKKDVPKVAQRYGAEIMDNNPFAGERSFRDRCIAFFNHAKLLLRKDGYHVSCALVETGKNFMFFELRMDDRAEKHMVIRQLAKTVGRIKGKSVILIGEAWVAPTASVMPGSYAADCPTKAEGLILNGLTKDGDYISVHSIFRRTVEGIEFDEDIIDTGNLSPILAPFLELWRIRKKTT